MSKFKRLYIADNYRYGPNGAKGWVRKFLYYFRRVSTCSNKLALAYYRLRFYFLSQKHGMEIPRGTEIGEGLYIGHPFNITINEKTKLGKNVNIHKGVTIGQENRGNRAGVPVIGNNVWIGVNATIVGNISIGDDVLIAPNAYVNCSVESHSIVIGNPCKVIHKENATDKYVTNVIDVPARKISDNNSHSNLNKRLFE